MRADVSFYHDKNRRVGLRPKITKRSVNLNSYMKEYKIEMGTLGYLHKIQLDGIPEGVDVDQVIRCKLLHERARYLEIKIHGADYNKTPK